MSVSNHHTVATDRASVLWKNPNKVRTLCVAPHLVMTISRPIVLLNATMDRKQMGLGKCPKGNHNNAKITSAGG